MDSVDMDIWGNDEILCNYKNNDLVDDIKIFKNISITKDIV